ncbi:MAG: hypothetical protein QOH28_1118 [Actinomycetota bacterium]|nr:hypothetical protein [Actinomycetota bacterium]
MANGILTAAKVAGYRDFPSFAYCPAVHGRDAERETIAEFLDEARRGRSRALLIEGDAGTGKTSMCEYAVAQASDFFVVRAQGIESESELPFAGLAQLFGPLRSHLALIPAPQRRALAGAMALEPPTRTSTLALGAAMLSLLSAAAAVRPVLAVVDDAHWLDPASSAAISFAARRLGHESVVIVLAQRADQRHSVASAGVGSLTLGALTPEAATALLNEISGTPVSKEVGLEVTNATAGNPMALVAAVRLLSPGMLAGNERLPAPLPVDGRFDDEYRKQIERLPARTQRALLVLAADTSGSVVVLGSALKDCGLTIDDLEPAERAAIVHVVDVAAGFNHALVRSTVYHSQPPASRRRAHRALAEAAVVVGDSDREAWHLALATTAPDEEVAAIVERAADRAALIGGAAAAAAGMERAALLSAPGESRARRLVAAARMLFLAGRAEPVLAYVDEALRQTDSARVRADATRLRCLLMAFGGDSAGAVALARTEARDIARTDKEQAALVLTEIAVPSVWDSHASDALELARESHALAEDTGGLTALLAANYLAHMLLFVGESEEGERLLSEVYELWNARDIEATLMTAGPIVGFFCMEDYRRAGVIFDGATAAARRYGATAALPFYLATKAEIDFCTGDWPNAYAGSLQAVELAQETGQPPLTGYALATLARVEAGQGRLEECHAHAEEALDIGRTFGGRILYVYGGSALGFLDLTLGDASAARSHLAPLVTWMVDKGWSGLLSKERFLPDLIEATILTDDEEEAERLLVLFETVAHKSRRVLAQAAALRCRALVVTDDTAESMFVRALELHRQTMGAFEEARTRLHFGEWLLTRDRRRDARRQLASANTTFERLGATPWAARVISQMDTSDEQPSPTSPSWHAGLTPQELQVAIAIANGESNKEAAATLFVSTKTVEFHLSNVYRKLGVRSRTQLARTFWAAEQERPSQE